MSEYYDWPKTFSYNADVTIVVGPRGIGKTYGLRLQCVKDFIKRGATYCEIVRYKETLKIIENGYYDRLSAEFCDYEFKIKSHIGYCKRKDLKDWHVLTYFVALSSAQMQKLATAYNVGRLIFDEFTLDRSQSNYNRYLKNEYETVANVVDTLTRQRSGDGQRPHLYLLGNALDVSNPFFYAYGVLDPKPGYNWYAGKTMLLHYCVDIDYSLAKARDTVAGRMLAGTESGNTNIFNEFSVSYDYIAEKKPAYSNVICVIVYRGEYIRIWGSYLSDLLYVDLCRQSDTRGARVYYLLKQDGSTDRIAIKRVSDFVKSICSLYYAGLIRYANIFARDKFLDLLTQFGIH